MNDIPTFEFKGMGTSPAWRVIRAMRGDLTSYNDEPSRDQRFHKLLWRSRPRLVCAAGLWDELRTDHPELLYREALEPKYEAVRKLLDATDREESTLPPNMGPALLDEIGKTREETDRQGGLLLQLLYLGWGRWWPNEEGELPRTPGGGAPQPRWLFECKPQELDRGGLGAAGEWLGVEAFEEQRISSPARGATLRQEVVAAVWESLGRPKWSQQATRDQVAYHLPRAYPELFADTGPHSPLRNALKNADYHAE